MLAQPSSLEWIQLKHNTSLYFQANNENSIWHLYARHCSKHYHFINIWSTICDRYCSYPHFYRWGNQETGGLSNLPKTSQLKNGRAGTWIYSSSLCLCCKPYAIGKRHSHLRKGETDTREVKQLTQCPRTSMRWCGVWTRWSTLGKQHPQDSVYKLLFQVYSTPHFYSEFYITEMPRGWDHNI